MKRLLVTVNNREYDITPAEHGSVVVDGRTVSVDFVEFENGQFSVRIDGRHYSGFFRREQNREADAVSEADRQFVVSIGDRDYDLVVDDEISLLRKSFQRARETSVGTLVVKAPMPGLVVRLDVSSGDHVKAGQSILVLEAMKMENEIRASESGVVQTIHVAPGTAVEKGEPLVSFTRE